MSYSYHIIYYLMGRYFGIANRTTNHKVSSYWKGEEFCDCHDLMHRYHWKPTDDIYSACYDTYCEFVYNPTDNIMELVYLNSETMDIDSDDSQKMEIDDSKGVDKTIELIDWIKLGFSPEKDITRQSDHVPVWNSDNVCTVCNYQFKNDDIITDTPKFSSTFHMN